MTNREYANRLLGNTVRDRLSYSETPRWLVNNGIPLSADWHKREAEINRLSHEETKRG